MSLAPTAEAQSSLDCGDVVPNGVIDANDLDTLRRYLAGDPAAPDLQGDPQGLARCDVTGDGLCDVGDYARIRRYMIDLTGGLNETCPLAGTTYPPVVLAPPVVDQASTLSTDRASIVLSGSALPGDLIRITGGWGRPSATTDADGTWLIEVPLVFDQVNSLEAFADYGAGYRSAPASIAVTQTAAAGDSTIAGRVIEAADGSPIEAATVHVGQSSTSTDAFGRFEIPDLPEGRIMVRVEHPDFVPEAYLTYSGREPVPEFGPALDNVGLTRSAAGTVVGSAGGTVTSAQGISLDIPAGSLAGDVELSLTDLPLDFNRSSGGVPLVDIGPPGLVFDPPAILRLPTSMNPGTRVDLAQIDQLSGLEFPRIGIVNANGEVEIEIPESNGDKIIYDFDDDPVEILDQLPTVSARRAIANCGGRLAETRVIPGGRAKKYDFDFSNASWFDPLLGPKLTELPDLVGDLKDIPFEKSTLLYPIARGNTDIVNITYEAVRVRQRLYAYRYPEGGGASAATRHYVGDVTYFVVRPIDVQLETRSTTACPRPKASAWGDPHLVRFDHVGQSLTALNGNGRYDFQAAGEFVLFESTEDGLTVQARFEQLPARPSATITKAAALDLEGDRVMIDVDASALRVRVGGVVEALSVGAPVVLPGGGELERLAPANGQDVVVARWADGSSLRITLSAFLGSEYLNLYPELASPRAAKVQGLLGNANGILGDDYSLRDGTPADPAELYTTYADSWRISQAESLFDYEPGEDTTTYNGVPPDPELTLDDLDPADRAAAEATCIAAGIDEDPLFSECALDVALLGGAATGGALETLDQVPDLGTYLAVSGQSSIFQAGQASPVDLGGGGGAGLLPTELPLDPGAGRVMRVLDSAGAVTYSDSATSMPTDGMDFGDIRWGSWNALAGPATNRMGQTLGVFLDDTLPATAPPPLDCGDLEPGGLAPEIGQIFCLGDGLSAFNERQTFFVPDAATRLFVGFAERLASQLLESDVHHLGDNVVTTGLFALAPDPEGVSWTTDPFAVPDAYAPSSARLTFDLAETNPGSLNSVRVNGVFLGYLPGTGTNASAWTEDVTYAVDPSVLSQTGNTIEFRSVGSDLDDYLIRDVRFEFVPPFVALPDAGEPGAIHVGDNVGSGGLFALMPEPFGPSWESAPFEAPESDLLLDARVVLDIAQTDFSQNDVLVNGVRVGFLPVRTNGSVWSPDIALSFDPALLQETGNRVTVRSTTSGGLNFDDFMIQNIRVEIATLESAPPGGYSDNSGVHEFIIEVSP